MKLETVMRKIQEADVALAEMYPEETYEFYYDMGMYMERMGHYSKMYYDKCEKEGLTLEEAKEQLGEFLRGNLTVIREDIQ